MHQKKNYMCKSLRDRFNMKITLRKGVTSLGIILIATSILVSCASEKKKAAPIYSYQLPWSGSDLVRSMTVTIPSDKAYDGSARLAAYVEARSRIKSVYMEAIRALPLAGKVTVGQVLDQKPAVRRRVETFLDHARIREVSYRPGQGLYLEEVAYLGSDFQSL